MASVDEIEPDTIWVRETTTGSKYFAIVKGVGHSGERLRVNPQNASTNKMTVSAEKFLKYYEPIDSNYFC